MKPLVISLLSSDRNMVKIYVGKLSGDTTDEDLRQLFEQFGTVEEASIVRNKDIGFVHMANEEMAMSAVR